MAEAALVHQACGTQLEIVRITDETAQVTCPTCGVGLLAHQPPQVYSPVELTDRFNDQYPERVQEQPLSQRIYTAAFAAEQLWTRLHEMQQQSPSPTHQVRMEQVHRLLIDLAREYKEQCAREGRSPNEDYPLP